MRFCFKAANVLARAAALPDSSTHSKTGAAENEGQETVDAPLSAVEVANEEPLDVDDDDDAATRCPKCLLISASQ